jgi:hypothetical protein
VTLALILYCSRAAGHKIVILVAFVANHSKDVSAVSLKKLKFAIFLSKLEIYSFL